MVQGQGGLIYNVDIVMCIDKTGSMGEFLAETKRKALTFHTQFVEEMTKKNKRVDELRIKVIGFGDYICDTRPMMISPFFTLPDENAAFEEFVNNINAEGGGDEPENALEALAHAMKSDWTQDGDVRRHVIMLFTDTSALELGARTNFENDDECMAMPANLAELGDWWDEMENRAKRILFFAPNAAPWDDLSLAWDNTVHIPSKAGEGCEEVDMDTAIKQLVNSIGQIAQQ